MEEASGRRRVFCSGHAKLSLGLELGGGLGFRILGSRLGQLKECVE